MEKFSTYTGKVITLPLNNVDTDMIIPAQYLTNITKEGYAETLFRRLREQDPQFPFNLDKFKGASILIADNNFGCGSSREHAVWALLAAGIKVVIAKSFADIFYSNSAKNGLLLINLPASDVDALLEQGSRGDLLLTLDLDRQIISCPDGIDYSFQIDPFSRHCLLEGIDELDYILSHKERLQAFWAAAQERTFSRL